MGGHSPYTATEVAVPWESVVGHQLFADAVEGFGGADEDLAP